MIIRTITSPTAKQVKQFAKILVTVLSSHMLNYQKREMAFHWPSPFSMSFCAYDQFGKAEISERIALLVQLVQLVWNDDMFK